MYRNIVLNLKTVTLQADPARGHPWLKPAQRMLEKFLSS